MCSDMSVCVDTILPSVTAHIAKLALSVTSEKAWPSQLVGGTVTKREEELISAWYFQCLISELHEQLTHKAASIVEDKAY